jgi:hypothetical protein
MECPQCQEEPIKVFGRWGGGVGIRKNLKGYVRCIECDALLKMSLGKPFWISLILFVSSIVLSGLSVLALYLAFEYDLFDPSIFPAWLFMGLYFSLFVFLAAMGYTAAFYLEFEEVESR